MPSIADIGGDRRRSLEDLGFSRTHRRDGSIDDSPSLPNDTFSTKINTQLTQTEQEFPDWSIVNETIGSMRVNKLLAGTITSKKITLDITPDGGDVWIAAGKTDFDDTTNGFILGIDDSDNDLVKMVLGNATNSMNFNGTNLYVNNSNLSLQDIYGTGEDGDVTISGNTSLTTDMFYTNLTIDSGVTLDTAGFRVHVPGTLTVNGTIGRAGLSGNAGSNGGDASPTVAGTPGTAGTAGAAQADGSLKGTIAGENGSDGKSGITQNNPGNDCTASGGGTAVAKSLTGTTGVDGGKGGGRDNGYAATIGKSTNGSGTTNNGGSSLDAGVGIAPTGTVFNVPNTVMGAWLLQDFFPSNAPLTASPSSTGGTGGAGAGAVADTGSGGRAASGGGGGGGGAGSPGGIVGIYAKIIVVSATGVITAAGGAGGNGGNAGSSAQTGSTGAAGGSSGGGGGAGGNGGALVIIYSTLTNSGSVTVAGGAGGTGGTGAVGTSTGGLENATWGHWSGATGETGTTGATGNLVQLAV